MAEVTMPRLSDTMTEGTIARWLKKPGDQVQKGEILLEIETDKATMELEAYEGGVVEKVLVGEGETVPIGQPIMLIGDGSGASAAATPAPAPAEAPKAEAPVAASASAPAQAAPEKPAEPQRTYGYGTFPGGETAAAPGGGAAAPASTAAPAQTEAPPAPNGEVRASPMARAIARDKGIDLASVQGSGPGGRVIRADVEKLAEGGTTPPTPQPSAASAPAATQAAAPSSAAAPAAVQAGPDQEIEEVPLNNIRKVTGRRMVESLQSAPHFFLTSVYDVTRLIELRKQVNAELEAAGDDTRVSVNDLIVKACALTLRAQPDVNVSFGGDKILRKKRIHIGIAVALENGLIVPVLRDPDQKSVGQIARESKALIDKARAGKLTPADYSGGTFTISNLGMFGIEHFTAVINSPEAAILAVGMVTKEPVVIDGDVQIRDRMRVTLSVDHRVLDGANGARYLQALKGFLEHPMRLLV
ncbi:MAG: 2-oxo acid dehydrogenase subunit E2 [Chloroflexi bacterium]|nr:2-oxo acid dehydrogenase subunit E2 [Chloroflexota bacterium]